MASSGTSSQISNPSAPLVTPTIGVSQPIASSGALVPTTTLPLSSQPPPPPQLYAVPADTLQQFTNAVQGIQNQLAFMNFQMGDLAARVGAIDGRASPTMAQFHQSALTGSGGLPASSMPALTDISSSAPSAPLASGPASAPLTSAAAPQFGVPITHISFPHSPSPVPSFESIVGATAVSTAPAVETPPRVHVPPAPEAAWEGHVVPKYHKLVFPTFDGKEDPLGG